MTLSPCRIKWHMISGSSRTMFLYTYTYFETNSKIELSWVIVVYHTCDRVAMLQLEICKFLAGDLVS